ncbi:hypothetical protein V3C99_017985 [Haemonchus contortus]|uniref:Uncharacterized protein n=1 Tax=Haemonchus contortus TaxID=6289 RepID=A0A7I4Z2P4_HAECO
MNINWDGLDVPNRKLAIERIRLKNNSTTIFVAYAPTSSFEEKLGASCTLEAFLENLEKLFKGNHTFSKSLSVISTPSWLQNGWRAPSRLPKQNEQSEKLSEFSKTTHITHGNTQFMKCDGHGLGLLAFAMDAGVTKLP